MPVAAAASEQTTAADRSGPRQLLSRDERRAQLLAAAARAFAAGGFAATSMDDVAAEAGVTKLIVYRHFDSKEELYASVLDAVSTRMRDEWSRLVGERGVERGIPVRALLTVARENPAGYRLLVFHAAREPQFEQQAFGYWQDAVAGVDALMGPIVREPAMRPWVVRSIMSYLLHSVLLWLETGDPADDDTFVVTAADGARALFGAWTQTDTET